jgi:hypothetical protein
MSISVINGGGIVRSSGTLVRVFLVLVILLQAGAHIQHVHHTAAQTQLTTQLPASLPVG